MKAPKDCRHKFYTTSVTGNTSKGVVCTLCGFRVDNIPLTSTERRMYAASQKEQEKRIAAMHGLGWKYQEMFYKYTRYNLNPEEYEQEKKNAAGLRRTYKKIGKKPPHKITAKRYREGRDGFKWTGYDLIKKLDEFAKKHPEVVICHCDDSYHAGSTICLIPHRTDKEYWGTTVVIAPQFGTPPTEIFLYPGHAEGLVKALTVFNREGKAKHRKFGDDQGWFPDASIPEGFVMPEPGEITNLPGGRSRWFKYLRKGKKRG